MKKFILFFVLFAVLTSPFARAEVMGKLDGVDITEEEVMKLANRRMIKLLSKMYDIKRGALEDIIDERLLKQAAKKKGVTIAKLKKQVYAGAGDATRTEVKAIYQLQKKRFKGKSFEEVEKKLTNQVNQQKKQIAMGDFLEGLRKTSKIAIYLERPRAKVSIDDDPSKGTKGAPITLIEFSEFQCPYCRKARPTIDKILKEYKGKVHYVFRDFPLSFHKTAKGAANAANCAGEQGKYWPYNDLLWEQGGKFDIENLKSIAVEMKLDTKKFNKCVDDEKFYAEIDKDMKDGSSVGVTGTPAYFINGQFLSGAQPYANFKQLIDDELRKVNQ
jgi:protein-disulfide isomerase